jgi:hypothetical protein
MNFSPRSAILYTDVAYLSVSGIKPEAGVLLASTRTGMEGAVSFTAIAV